MSGSHQIAILRAGAYCLTGSTRAGVPRGQTARPQLAGGPFALPPPVDVPPTPPRPNRAGNSTETALKESRKKPQTVLSPLPLRPENQLSRETGSRIERGRTSADGQPGRVRTRIAAVVAELKRRSSPPFTSAAITSVPATERKCLQTMLRPSAQRNATADRLSHREDRPAARPGRPPRLVPPRSAVASSPPAGRGAHHRSMIPPGSRQFQTRLQRGLQRVRDEPLVSRGFCWSFASSLRYWNQ